MIWPPTRTVVGAELKPEGLFVLGFGLLEDSVVGPGGVAGTVMDSLHFGHGSVWPSNCSCRTTILLEQWGQASRKGAKGSTEPEQWKNRICQTIP